MANATTAPQPGRPPEAADSARWIGVLMPLAMGLVLFGLTDYRPFPSIDDFTYVPLARAAGDPALYPRDDILQGMMLHTPAWRLAVAGLEGTVGLPAGYWLLTLALTLASVWAAYRLMAALAPPARLFPLAALLAFAGSMDGIGRGAYDGALGGSFHVQWLALCLLLWAYDAVLRGRPGWAGAWLGAAALAHPVVAAHGALVLGVAALAGGGPRHWRRLAKSAVVCLAVGAPVILPLAHGLASGGGGPAGGAAAIVEDGFLFRTPHEFDLTGLQPPQAWLIALVSAAGLAGGVALWRQGAARARPSPERDRTALGLFAGHMLLLAASLALYGGWGPARWLGDLPAIYMVTLTRTTPLLFVLAAILLAAGLERALQDGGRAAPGGWDRTALGMALVVGAATLVVFNLPLGLATLALLNSAILWTVFHHRAGVERAAALSLTGLAAAFFVWAGMTHRLDAPPPAAEQALFDWARRETALDALFVIPPGLEGFRLHARRSVYVDFKTFPSAQPALIALWRARMERVAQPDGPALTEAGWPAVPYWDRAYAYANTPARIAGLLADTGADYLVWNRAGLEVPPFLPIDRPADGGVAPVFDNGAFAVYARADRVATHAP